MVVFFVEFLSVTHIRRLGINGHIIEHIRAKGKQRQAGTEMLQFPVMCLTKKLRCVTLLDNNNCETYTTHTYIYFNIYLSYLVTHSF